MNLIKRLSILGILCLFFAIPAHAADDGGRQLIPVQAGPSRLEQALAQATEIRQLIDQENPGRLLIQHPEWTPLLPPLLALIKEYSAPYVTFEWLSKLTNGRTWTPEPLDTIGRKSEVYLELCPSETAAYDKKTVNLRKKGDTWLSGAVCKRMLPGPGIDLDTLKAIISIRSQIPTDNLRLALQTDVDLITPCDGLESFLQRPKNFAHYIIRAYDKTAEEGKDDSPDQS